MANKIETVALLHPGNMGATIGAAAATSGARVLWASKDRGNATRRRADQAKLIDAGDLSAAVRQSDVVLSVCPPHAAIDVANAVAAEKFSGIYLDANAVSRAILAVTAAIYVEFLVLAPFGAAILAGAVLLTSAAIVRTLMFDA